MTPVVHGHSAEHTGRHFDHIAAGYNSSLPPHVVEHYLKRRVALVQSLVPAPGPVLDVGCGTGLLSWRLADYGYQVTGIDPSAGMLKEFPEGRPVGRVQAGGQALPFAGESFRLTITVAALHHMVDAELVAASLREMYRVTAPDGYVVVWDHNPLNPYWPLLMRRVPQDQEPTRLVPLGEILSGLQPEKADRIDTRRWGWVPEFAPRWSLPALAVAERCLEWLPGVRELSAHNVVVLRKRP